MKNVTSPIGGLRFLQTATDLQSTFTPEDLSPDHLAIARAADEFWIAEVEPPLEAIRHKDHAALLKVLRKSAELGFTGISIPEEYGGMDLDLASVMIVEEAFARDASYLVTHGGQAGIGALPLVFFGTQEQKSRYLPKLASAEMIACYALTEPQAGSDAMALRTTAELNAAGTHYILNGQKMWITNGAFADLLTVFARVVDHENPDGRLAAFLVERAYPGVSVGAEEKKMGLHGSSTVAVYLDNVAVPKENLLGEVGRGHIIAFNVLNVGRLKIGPYAVGAGKNVLSLSLTYAKDRRAFGTTISGFGAIQHKLAEMAALVFAAESMYWRVVGSIDAAMRSTSKLAAVEEFAVECSVVKVFASEAIGLIADEGVQIHGGYGFHQDYAVERIFRDSRIFRIFEGTNEINRGVIAGTVLKRIAKGRLTLPTPEAHSGELANQARQLTLQAFQLALAKFGPELERQQEVLMALSDLMIELFAIESTELRARKLESAGRGAMARDLASLTAARSAQKIRASFEEIATFCGANEAERLPLNIGSESAISLRRRIARRLLNAGRYVASAVD
jgi:butyryl-CoA dehydrogenase